MFKKDLRHYLSSASVFSVLALAAPAGAADKPCTENDRPNDGAVDIHCSGNITSYGRSNFGTYHYSYLFDELASDIKGGETSDQIVNLIYENVGIGVFDPSTAGYSELEFRFSGDEYGVDTQGHAIALSKKGKRGEDGEARSGTGDNGSAGKPSYNMLVNIDSGHVYSTFSGTPPQNSALRAAILVQAKGGSGGNGGDATNRFGSRSRGGHGGAGANSGTVKVVIRDGVAVNASGGVGVLVQSVAGDGGNGGNASALAGGATGGNGGAGAGGGRAIINMHGTVKADREGVVVRSLGGAGGNGGNAGSTIGSGTGGAGAGSGPGGKVSASISGNIATTGAESTGVLAQSVGGFSGDGGSGLGFVGFGASSQSAGDGGYVDFSLLKDGAITTTGDNATGALIQSIGGGGGVGGHGVGIAGLGGSGSAGGAGGLVEAKSAGTITTGGTRANALSAMSLGGGGGASGASAGIVSIGGKGGAGGNGGTVNVENYGTLITTGDESTGVSALSVGGGGGSAKLTGGAIAIGGQGGKGGSGGTVKLKNDGDIATSGVGSAAANLSSVGGGGGLGSNVFTAAVGFSLGIGGKGGEGGNGGSVTYVDSGEGYKLTTKGALSDGIAALSVGGGGGGGGSTFGAAVGKYNLQVSIGSDGGKGGNGGAVNVDTSAAISTKGDISAGISATSVGGGGGDSGTITQKSKGAVSLSVGIGGSAGAGGNGARSRVASRGSIKTTGMLSDGIIAQSVGGGGGNAQAASQAGVSGKRFSAKATLGKAGGPGGDSGQVEVDLSGRIETSGPMSRGLLAQSVAGGGGTGSAVETSSKRKPVSLDFAMGATGSVGGQAGDVSVTSNAGFTTRGEYSAALTAQSIGGGGGAGGSVVQASRLESVNLNVGLGGKGGIGGDGGAVDVSLTGGNILTWGSLSPAVHAQSVGGGGGDGGSSTTQANLDALSLAFSFGGTGGKPGKGGRVKVASASRIITQGDGSSGVLAQSIGGGGGSGGTHSVTALAPKVNLLFGGGGNASDGDASTVEVNAKNGSILTEGDLSMGIVAQSIGGGGGFGVFDIDDAEVEATAIILGGTASGHAANVTVQSDQKIETFGAESHAILAQSIGGGGGAALFDAGAKTNLISIGGTGSGGGNGKTVSVRNSGAIVTSGEEAAGIIAQSIGSGGGLGTNAMLTFGVDASELNLGSSVGGSDHGFMKRADGKAGTGGAVSVISGNIETSGRAAHGVVAQSVGGSGGIGVVLGADDELIGAMAGSAGKAKGDSGDVSVLVDGFVSVNGGEAHGIIAQSAAGDGSTSGQVTVEVEGTVEATGEGGRGILAQSAGSKPGAVSIVIAGGSSVKTSEGAREAILVLGGSENNLIENHGLVSGNVGGSNLSFTNSDDGILEFYVLDFDEGGSLTNSGIITAGKPDVVTRAEVGPYTPITQTDGGTILADHVLGDGVDVGADADMITFTSKVDLKGEIKTHITGESLVPSGSSGRVKVLDIALRSADSIVDLTASDTATVDYEISRENTGPNSDSYYLDYTVDYTPWENSEMMSALGATAATVASLPSKTDVRNADSFGNYMSKLVSVRVDERAEISEGGVPASPAQYDWVEDLANYVLNLETMDRLLDNYDMMVPNVHSAPLDATLLSGIDFASALLSCPEDSADASTVTAGNDVTCGWARLQGNYLSRSETSRTLGYDETSAGISGGIQWEIADGLSLGAGLSYEHASLAADYIRDGDGNRFQSGVILEKSWNGWTFGGGITGGLGVYDIDRLTRTPSGIASASSSSTVGFTSGHLRAARAFDAGDWTVTPKLDLGLHYQWRPEFSETGAGPYGVRISDYDELALTLSPAVEFATDVSFGDMSGRFFARAGYLGIVTGDRTMEAAFTGVPAGGPVLSVTDDPDRNFAKLAVGLDAAIAEGWNLSIEGKSLFSADQSAFSGSARLEYRF